MKTDDELRAELDVLPNYTPAPNGYASDTSDQIPVDDAARQIFAEKIAKIPLTPAAWAARSLPPPDYLLGELFSTTSRVLLAADTGLGKSMFALALSFAMRLGRDFLHWKSKRPARVLIIDGEMPVDLLQERIRLAREWYGIAADAITQDLYILSREDVEDMPPLDSPEGAAWLLDVIEAIGGVDFLVLDNCMCLTSGDLREETTWRALVPLSRELSRRKVGQLWLHHVGHDKTRVYGSRLFAWQMDAVGIGEAISDAVGDVSFKLTWQKSRRRTPNNRADFEPVRVQLSEGTWTGQPDSSGPIQTGQALNSVGRIALDALNKAIAATGQRPPYHDMTRGVKSAVTLDQWRRYFEQIAGYEDTNKGRDAQRKAFSRGKENVLGARKVRYGANGAGFLDLPEL